MANLSFETAHANQGQAADWTTSTANVNHEVAPNNSDPGVTQWTPQESFESSWRRPYLVHTSADTNLITAPNASDLPTALTLANEARYDYTAHVNLNADIHSTPDLLNLPTAALAANEATLIALVNDLKLRFNLHLLRLNVHGKKDTAAIITTADASDLATAITLVNAFKTNYTLHIATLGGGAFNESYSASFDPADLEASVHTAAASPYEDFEQQWAIADRYPTPLDQRVLVLTDVQPGPVYVSWPTGHAQLHATFELLASERLFDTFNEGWYLPGSPSTPLPNEVFADRYYDGSSWRFVAGHLQSPAAEDFESGWHDNGAFKTAYHDGSDWRFTPAHLESLTAETFESGWTMAL